MEAASFCKAQRSERYSGQQEKAPIKKAPEKSGAFIFISVVLCSSPQA